MIEYKKITIKQWTEIHDYPTDSYLFDYKGDLYYLVNDKRHRWNGPAVIWDDGFEEWCLHDKIHRIDGHASFDYDTGEKEWWLHGKQYSYDEWKNITDNYLVYLYDKYMK